MNRIDLSQYERGELGERRSLALARGYALAWLDLRETILCALGAEPMGDRDAWPVGRECNEMLVDRVRALRLLRDRIVNHASNLGDEQELIADAVLTEQAEQHGFLVAVEWSPDVRSGE